MITQQLKIKNGALFVTSVIKKKMIFLTLANRYIQKRIIIDKMTDYENDSELLEMMLNAAKIKKTQKNQISTKKNAEICTAAVKHSKTTAVKILNKNGILYKTLNEDKTAAYARCSKKQKSDSKYCGTHKKNVDSDNFFIFSKIAESSDYCKITDLSDDFFKKNALRKSTRKLNDCFKIEVTENLKDKLEEIRIKIESIKDDNDAESESKDDDDEAESESKDDEEADSESKDDDEEAESESNDNDDPDNYDHVNDTDAEDSDEQEQECVLITTTDGKEYALDTSSNNVYDNSDEENAVLLGKLTEVKNNKAPIMYENTQCIVSAPNEINFKKNKYTHCVLSDGAYNKKFGRLVLCGKVSKTKSGKFTVKLTKKK